MSLETAMAALNGAKLEPTSGEIGVPGSGNAPTPPIVEPKAETTPVEPPKVDGSAEPKPDSRLFASIARKEADIVRRQRELKQQQADIQKEREELARYRSLKATARTNSDKVLEEFGLDYKTITEHKLSEGAPTPEGLQQEFKTELQKLREEQAERDKAAQQREIEAAEQEKKRILEKFSDNVNTFVASNSDTYELINLHGTQKLVEAVIEQHYLNTQKANPQGVGKIMSIKEAADIVEKHLETQVERSVATKKWKSRTATPSPKTEEPKSQSQSKPPSATLTNQLTPSSAPSLQPAKTEAERIKRALARMEEVEKSKQQQA